MAKIFPRLVPLVEVNHAVWDTESMLQKHAQTNTDESQTQNKSRPDQAKVFTHDTKMKVKSIFTLTDLQKMFLVVFWL